MAQPLPTAGAEEATLHLKVGGMSCSFCVATLEKAVAGLPGVLEVHVNLAHEEAFVRYDSTRLHPARIGETLREIGYTVRDPRKVAAFDEDERFMRQARIRLAIAAACTLLALVLMSRVWLGAPAARHPLPLLVLALGTMLGPGSETLKMAWASARRGILNQHVLLELAALGGLAGGVWGFVDPAVPGGEFLAVTVFITTYHLLSGYASLAVRTGSSKAVRRLMALQPDTATVVRNGTEVELPVAEVRVGDLVRVRPGARIPLDGTVREGQASVHESLVTGEPMPVDKADGHSVIGGSVNLTGALLIEVTSVAEESFLARVIRYAEEARALKPSILQLVDRVLRLFVPAVLGVAGLTLVLWIATTWWAGGRPNLMVAVLATLSVLVMGYPCALGMATPLAMIRGGGRAAERGVLMRSADAFQVMGEIRHVVFDKTGTITEGRPEVTEVHSLDGRDQDLLARAAAVEAMSEHPLGRAIVAAAVERNLDLPDASEFVSVAGVGMEGRVAGERIRVLRPASARGEEAPGLERLEPDLERLEAQGQTVVVVLGEGGAAGLIAIGDGVRADAREAVSWLKGHGMEPVLVTGDNARAAASVARQVGIDRVLAEVLPQDKASIVRGLQAGGGRVMMIGDGINDAPALTQADVGVAMGTGTDIAIEAADVTLMRGDLRGVVAAIDLSRATLGKIRQNLFWALVYNSLGVPIAALGHLNPIIAGAAMAMSSVSVTANSTLLKRYDAMRRFTRRVSRPAEALSRG